MSQFSALNVDPLVTDHLHTAEYLVRSPIVENGDNEEEDRTYNNFKIKLFFYISYISIRIEIHRKKPQVTPITKGSYFDFEKFKINNRKTVDMNYSTRNNNK